MTSKQPLRNDKPAAIDDFDSSFNFDFDDHSSGNKRDPGSPLKRGVTDALKSHFTRPENYREYVGKTLPRQYGELADDYTQLRDGIKDAADSLRRQAKQPMHELAKNLKGKTKEGTRINRWLGKVADATEDFKFDTKGAEKARAEATKLAVADVFSGWKEEQDVANQEREEVEGDRFAQQFVKLESQERLLAGIAKGTDHHVRYLTNVDLPYRKKSLELQYRVAHGVTDMVALMRGLVEQQRKQLDIVIKNTALPEIQKQQLSENFKQNLRNKFVDKTLGGFGGEKGFLGAFTKNLKETAELVGQGLSMGLEQAASASQVDNFDEGGPEASKRKVAKWLTENILDKAGPGIAGGISRKAMRSAPKATRRVFDGARKIGYLRNNAQAIAQQYANGGIGGKDEVLRAMVGFMTPGRDTDTKVNRVSGRKLLEGTHFDHATRRSIVEVIPGYLARILQEIQITRTGDTGIKPLAFNYARSTFETQAQGIASIRGLTAKSSKRQGLNEIISDLEKGGAEFTPEQRDELATVLISARRGGRTMTPNSLMSERFFTAKGQVSQENAEVYSQAFRKQFDGNERGRFTDSKKGLRGRNRFFEKLADTDDDLINVRAGLQDMFDTGQADLAYASGLMNQDGTINTKALYAGLAGAALPGGVEAPVPENARRRRGQVQNVERVIQREVPAPAAAAPTHAPTDQAQKYYDQHLRLVEVQNDLTRQFYVRNHDDLMAILEHLRTIDVQARTIGEAPTMPGQPAPKASWGDRFKGMFSRGKAAATESAQNAKQGWDGYWNSTMRDNVHHVRDRAGEAASFLGRNLSKGFGGLAGGLGKFGSWAGDKLSKSRLVGARYMKDFKDGIPDVGDLYVQGQEAVRITKAMLENGEIRDQAGKVIRTLAEVAEAAGDLYNDTGDVVLTHADRLRSYVKANGEVITQVWVDRVKRGAARAKAIGIFAGLKALQGGRAGAAFGGRVGRTAAMFTRELLMPPRDVYVKGEKEPRLFAYLMRAGSYTNTIDGSVITRPTQIKGPVQDSEGNYVLTDADIKRGLVDVDGKPFPTLHQRAAAFLRKNLAAAAKFTKRAAKAVGEGLQTAGRLAGTFLTRGMDGVRAGGWKKPRKEAKGGGEGGSCCDEQLTILVQIRDILEERLGRAQGASSWSPSNTPAGADVPNINTPPDAPEASTGATTTNVMGGMGSMLGSLAGGAVKGLAALKRRGKASWTASMGAPAAAAEGEEAPQEEKKKEEPVEKKLTRTLRKLWSKPKPAEAKPAGPRTKGDANGDGLRDGSGEDIRANWKNINAPTKTLEDVKQAQSYERKNTVDMITGAIMSGFKSLGGFLGDAADLFTRGGAGRAAGKAGGGLLRGAARAGGWAAGKAAGVAGAAARGAGGFLGRGLAGAGGRMAMLRGAGAVAGKVAGFAAKRVLMPVLGGAAAVLGAPGVATALAIGGAIWTAKEIYDYFQDKKDPVSKSDRRTLQLLRMAEYGAPLKDYGAHNKLLKLEAFLEGAVKMQSGKTELDKAQIDSDKLLAIAEISAKDDSKVQKFLEWFNQRFTPVYLKWMTTAKAAGKSLSGLEDLAISERLKVLQAVASSDGWDVRTNPFGSEELQIGSKEIGFLRDAMQKDWEKDKTATKGVKDPMQLEGLSAKEGLAATRESILKQVAGGGHAEQRNFSEKIAPAMIKGANSKQFATFTSEGAKRVQTGGLTALQSIRMRMYGFAEPTFADVHAIRSLEDAVYKDVKPDNVGKATFNGDLAAVYSDTAKYFGLSPSDSESETRWRMWFQYRFLPVYTTFIAQLNQQAGLRTEDNLERTVDAVKLYAIAQGVAGVPGVWEYDAMPRANQSANVDAKSIEVILNNLKAEADKQKVTESSVKPAQTTQEQRSTGNLNSTQTPTRSMPNAAQMQTTSLAVTNQPPKMPNTMPDVETEPKGSGGAQPGVKPPPQLGSLVHAPGELASGNNGMQYVKAPSAQAIEGLHPETKRLFLAMAEEYGELTKQSIQVNRGFVTKAEQAEQYARTPEKAAPPGSSLHEFGMALDINSVDANRLEKLGLMRKYGFTRPVGGETWHIEPAGIQHDVRGLRNDPAAAAQAIAASVGKGGGGVGATKTGFRLGGRDTEYALKVRDSSSSETKAPGSAGGFAGSVENQRSGAEAIQTAALQQSSGGVGGAPAGAAANESLYASLPTAQTKEDSKALVQQTAAAMGIDPKLAMTTVAMESGFKSEAKAGTSSATGLNQFTKGTWSDMMKKHAKDYGIPADTSPSDPRANAIMGVKYTQENLEKAKAAGLPQDITSAYMMHFMGPAGGRKALGLEDNAVMAQVFPQQASANKSMFYNEDGSPRTKAQFLEHVNNKINRAAKDFGISDQLVQTGNAGTQLSAANQPMFRRESAPAPEQRTMRAPQPMGAFDLQQQPDRSMRTAPAASPHEVAMIKALNDGNQIQQQQLETQKAILEQVTTLVEMGKQAQASAAAAPVADAAPTGPAPAVSRAERAMRAVSAPAYRTGTRA